MKVVGILGDATGDPYSLRLAQAVAAELAKENAHAISFMGGFPQAPLYRDASNLPKLPAEPFRTWWKKHHGDHHEEPTR